MFLISPSFQTSFSIIRFSPLLIGWVPGYLDHYPSIHLQDWAITSQLADHLGLEAGDRSQEGENHKGKSYHVYRQHATTQENRWLPRFFDQHLVLAQGLGESGTVSKGYLTYLIRALSLTLMLLVDNVANTKWCKVIWKMTETLAHGYSSESTQWELSNEYKHDRVKMVFKDLSVLVFWRN